MIIKRWGGSAFVEEYPKTTSANVFTADGATQMFSADKLLPAYLPDSVFDTLKFYGVTGANMDDATAQDDARRGLLAEALIAAKNAAVATGNIQNVKGYYWVVNDVTGSGIISDVTAFPGTVTTDEYVTLRFRPQDGGSASTTNTSSGTLEVGDWFVIESISGTGASGTPWVFTASVINNTYENASTSVDGVVRLSSRTTYASLSGNNVVGESTLKTVIDNAAFASGTHVHGNITNAGAIGSTANLPLITTTSGVVTVGAFGTGATNFTAGNDARLSDARTPTSHVHGNITNVGAIGSTANLPIITTTSGVLVAGSFGSTANTFTQGNDSRLSDARTPTSHVHGNITNVGAIGSTANLPLITTTSGVVTVGAFGTGATNFTAGNDARLSDARTPTSHVHGNISNGGVITTNTAAASGQHLVITSSADLVQQSAITLGTGTTTFLRNDGTWGTPVDTNTTYGIATDTTAGLVELFSDTDQSVAANTVSTTAGRTYGIQLNAANQMVVNVPWSDTNTVSTATALGGLSVSSNSFQMVHPFFVQADAPATPLTGTIWFDI